MKLRKIIKKSIEETVLIGAAALANGLATMAGGSIANGGLGMAYGHIFSGITGGTLSKLIQENLLLNTSSNILIQSLFIPNIYISCDTLKGNIYLSI